MNYTMPPRNKASDYAKGKISQDEIIALQIANDANIASARKAVKMGEVQQLTLQQGLSPDELLADDASQEATAMSNVKKLGFRDQEVSAIITNIRSEADLDFSTLNANFPAIEADIRKRFNVRLLTPSFFIEYMKKYSDELADATGLKNVFNPNNAGLNNLVNTISELKKVIPDRNVIEFIRENVQQINQRLAFGQIIAPYDFEAAELERLRDLLPNAEQLRNVESLGIVEKQRIIDQLLTQFANLPSQEDLRQLAINLRDDRIDRTTFIASVRAIISAIPPQYSSSSAPVTIPSSAPLTPSSITRPLTQPLDDDETPRAKSGLGFKRGQMMRPNKMKVGRGLAVKETPSYREYGKYAIHIPQLEQQDILNVKYKSLGQIPKFKPIPVSDIFRDFIVDLVENGKPNARVYTQICPKERKYFEEMSIGAGVWNSLGLKRTTTSTDEDEAKRFELLKGEYMAGNNNPKVISELRHLVVKMMSDGRIRKTQGVELLMELSI